MVVGWEWLIRVSIIISFGINPRRGGSPPRERSRIEMDNEVFEFMGWEEGSCLMLYRLIIWRRIIRDPDVRQ